MAATQTAGGRTAVAGSLRRSDGDARRTAPPHAEPMVTPMGMHSVFIMARHLALHDVLHGYRIEERLLRPDCGV